MVSSLLVWTSEVPRTFWSFPATPTGSAALSWPVASELGNVVTPKGTWMYQRLPFGARTPKVSQVGVPFFLLGPQNGGLPFGFLQPTCEMVPSKQDTPTHSLGETPPPPTRLARDFEARSCRAKSVPRSPNVTVLGSLS